MHEAGAMSGIQWDRVRAVLAESSKALLKEIQEAHDRDLENPAHAIDRILKARLVELQQRFERLKAAHS